MTMATSELITDEDVRHGSKPVLSQVLPSGDRQARRLWPIGWNGPAGFRVAVRIMDIRDLVSCVQIPLL
jgi:hypothetical protein